MSINIILPSSPSRVGLVPASTAFDAGELLWRDSADGLIKPASLFTNMGVDATATQTNFSAVFAGIAQDRRLVGENAQALKSFLDIAIADCDCPAQTFKVGDKVGVLRSGVPNVTNGTVTAAASLTTAIGVVVGTYGNNATKVRVKFVSKLFNLMI
ncbi:hypothetical protein KIH39_00010 [Telmatocola sphagniphila]|uniref:Uncharacterized protein n=1 Tax=Telmatocola sphagniphila TaxID=1123043 RepID=A0A8E6B5J5_9BACT|nr:hypothetical protein [Telmatocola sphagniphila]QVL32338.1 hypothetical protein KIH39_00010 [Telmatocola sphagniphila]